MPWVALVLCAVGATWTPAAAAPVLQPGQDLRLREALDTGGDSIDADWRIEGFSVVGDRVDVSLAGPDGAAATATIRGEASVAGSVATPLGWVVVPGALPAAAAEALLAKLRAAPRPLEWTSGAAALPPSVPSAALDPARARTAQSEVSARLAARRGLTAAARAPLDRVVESALELLSRGDAAAARALLDPPVRAALAPGGQRLAPGALSVWLAAGGEPALPTRALAERFPDEPRVAALMSAALRADAASAAAAHWVAHGLTAALDDALLIREARALGLTVADPPPHALPAPAPPSESPAWPWQLAGLALALALATSALAHRSAEAALALAAALAALATAIPRPHDRAFPELPPELLAPVAAGPCQSGPARRDGASLLLRATCPAGDIDLVVRAATRDGDSPAAPPAASATDAPPANQRATAAHVISLPNLPRPSAAAAASLEALAEAVRAAEQTGFRLAALPPPPPPAAARPTFADATPALRAELRLGAAALAAALALALATLARTLATLARHGPPRTPAERATAAAFALAIAVHAFAPAHMVMVYGGYGLVSDLAAGTIPRYGVGTLFAYGPLLWALPPDHATLQIANRLLGLACLALAYALGTRLVARTPVARAATAWLFALLPVIPFDHASESIVILPTFLALAGLLRLTAPAPPRGVLAAALLAAAALCRPELLVVSALVPFWLLAARHLAPADARRAAAVFALTAAPLVAAQLAQALSRSAALQSQGALPGLDSPLSAALAGATHRGILARPDYAPPVVLALVVLALVLPGPHRRAALATAALAAAWMAATAIDLVDISVPRLHMPALLLLLPVAGTGFALLLERAPARLRIPAPTLAALAAALLLAGSAWSAWRLYRPTNEAAEERFWRDTAAVVQASGGCVATIDYPDPPAAGKTPRFVPGYLLPEGPDRHPLYPLTELPAAVAACPGPLYVALGLRCYAAYREGTAPPPPGREPLPICASAFARADLTPVFERDLPNRGDLGFPLYPAGSPLRVGLYRVARPAGAAGAYSAPSPP